MVKQLAEHLGEEVFVAGLRSYIRQFRVRNATFEDLIGTWTSAGAADLDSWARGLVADRRAGHDRPGLGEPDPRDDHPDAAGAGSADRVHALAVGSIDRSGGVSLLARGTVADDPLPVPPCPAAPCWWSRTRPMRPGPRSGSGPTGGRGWPGAAVDHRRAGAGGDLQRDPRRGSRCRPEPGRGPGPDRQRHSRGRPRMVEARCWGSPPTSWRGRTAPVAERPARLARVRDVATSCSRARSPVRTAS